MRVKSIGICAVTAGLIAGCGGGGTQRGSGTPETHVAASVTASPPSCPRHPASPVVETASGPRLVPVGSTSVQVCGYVRGGPLKDEPSGGVELNANAASVLAAVVSGLPLRRNPGCPRRPADGLLRFDYPDRPSVSVAYTSAHCSGDLLYVGGVARGGAESVVAALGAIAGAYGKGSSNGSVPDITGLGTAAAAHHSRSAHFSVMFGGEVISRAWPTGTVLLQDPPAGGSHIGRQVDAVMSTQPAPPCRPRQLHLTYRGGEEGAGSVFGGVEIRDTSARQCRIRGPIAVEPLDAHRDVIALKRPMAPAVPPPPVILTAKTPRTAVAHEPRFGEVVVEVDVSGEYRDGPSPNGDCRPRDESDPTYWRLTINRHHLTVANRQLHGGEGGTGSVEGCLGALRTDEAQVS
jgi:hypothetical protein